MHTYDFIGIGLGPFNLGLACLTEPIDELDGLFLEAREAFDWHPGMMLPDATLQVPFLADLVTMADPTSPYSFLAFLKATGRLYPFYIRESFYPLRAEYNQYCQWASEQLASVRFGQAVHSVEHDGEAYVVRTTGGESHRTRRLVLGTGTTPKVPEPCIGLDGPVLHSADYLGRKPELQRTGSITVVGSGQSAAEVYADLLADIEQHDYSLRWVTRSPRFFPMEYTKLTLEMTSPEYTRYFQSLPAETRGGLLRDQRGLYKGISSDTIDAIFDTLYAKQVAGGVPTTLLTCMELTSAAWDGSSYTLGLHHQEQHEDIALETESLVLATGYGASVPAFLDPVRDRIRWDEQGSYAATETYDVDVHGGEIFVQNGEEHTHGFVAPDLGMGAYRSSVIIARMLGHEVYPVERRIAFQEFGAPERMRVGQAVVR
ncbi:lysine N(6)-hydroxylase/L-ornithine N(5)-oxygenase family protein [Luteipulveratus halotolerans]|uniref:L-lysine N6-monooxygenase MbtG n=1 Tax=Luteipulveratus halotolerans TaxID=1631356 RepID=A0A0L6CHA1_9MICO|nr:SidA/IucD/PvdA family monooxygenase [Luteipulveratus halotolerans]KNX37191.1 alcaligin biosynthesis protein [Luteipulveratus halotolerans]